MISNSFEGQFRSNAFIITVLTVCSCAVASCAGSNLAQHREQYPTYPDWHASQYILPYNTGETHPLIQGNCELDRYPWTHNGRQKFAYDFGMPIGTAIIAARSGTVVFVRDQFTDNDHGKNQGNAVVLLHPDGSFALYAHITLNGSKVKLGQVVKQGELIALSGNSGESPEPHLHFQVNQCGDFVNCDSMPVSFRNANPATDRLERGMSYTAENPE